MGVKIHLHLSFELCEQAFKVLIVERARSVMRQFVLHARVNDYPNLHSQGISIHSFCQPSLVAMHGPIRFMASTISFWILT